MFFHVFPGSNMKMSPGDLFCSHATGPWGEQSGGCGQEGLRWSRCGGEGQSQGQRGWTLQGVANVAMECHGFHRHPGGTWQSDVAAVLHGQKQIETIYCHILSHANFFGSEHWQAATDLIEKMRKGGAIQAVLCSPPAHTKRLKQVLGTNDCRRLGFVECCRQSII